MIPLLDVLSHREIFGWRVIHWRGEEMVSSFDSDWLASGVEILWGFFGKRILWLSCRWRLFLRYWKWMKSSTILYLIPLPLSTRWIKTEKLSYAGLAYKFAFGMSNRNCDMLIRFSFGLAIFTHSVMPIRIGWPGGNWHDPFAGFEQSPST